jgi:DNA topoisomerase-1
MLRRAGPHGLFLACVRYPGCRFTESIDENGARLARIPTGERCEECDGRMILKCSSRGPFQGCEGFPYCRHTRDLPSGFAVPEGYGRLASDEIALLEAKIRNIRKRAPMKRNESQAP